MVVITKLEDDVVTIVGVFDDDHEDEAHTLHAKLSLDSVDGDETFNIHDVDEINCPLDRKVHCCEVFLESSTDDESDDEVIHIVAIRETEEFSHEDDDELAPRMKFYAGEEEEPADLRKRALEQVSDWLDELDSDDAQDLSDELDHANIPYDAIRIDYREYAKAPVDREPWVR